MTILILESSVRFPGFSSNNFCSVHAEWTMNPVSLFPVMGTNDENVPLACRAMSKAKGIATGALKFFKKPWQITGPASSPEFLEALPDAADYRKHAPATQPKRVFVPQAEPEHVFDIKYYTRDRRRTPPTTTMLEVSPSEITLEGLPPVAGKWYEAGKLHHFSDNPGEGYQK